MKARNILLLLACSLLLTSCLDVNNPKLTSSQTISVGDVSFRMIYVPAGTFTMGSTGPNAALGRPDEFPTHTVILGSYYICETEITASVWNTLMHDTLSGASASLPATSISYDSICSFIVKLNATTGYTFALPTEAQWEYAARGGESSANYLYAGSDNIDLVAVYDTTHCLPVSTLAGNTLDIYDMSGNVAEWCADWYGPYSSEEQNMPVGPATGTERVVRGGSYRSIDSECRVSARSHATPDTRSPYIGFRLILYPSTIQ